MTTNRITIHIRFGNVACPGPLTVDDCSAVVDIDTATGSASTVSGTLFPADVGIINSIVQTLRAQKDRYQPRREGDRD